MPRFHYRAMDRRGKVAEGEASAPNLAALTEFLRGQGQFLLSGAVATGQAAATAAAAAAAAQAPKERKNKSKSRKPTEAEVIAFNGQLQLMISSAVPISEALVILARQQPNPVFCAVIRQISEAVQGGNSLPSAFAQHPSVFDSIYISLLEAGQKGGMLPQMLERISAYLEFKALIRTRIKSALLYPAAVMGTALVVVLGLIIFVLPNFAEVFEQFDAELPPLTVFLLWLSASLRGYWYAYLGTLAFVVWRVRAWLKNETHRYATEMMMLSMPVVGAVLRAIILARIARILGELLKSGMNVLKALELAEATAGDVIFARMIRETHKGVCGGLPVSVGFARCDYMPDMVPHLLASAEKSGRLPEALAFLAGFYEKEIDVTLKDFFAILEPMFVLFLGFTIGVIALAFLVPIFRLGGIVQ